MLIDYTSQPMVINGIAYDQRHGGPFDRGAADASRRDRAVEFFAGGGALDDEPLRHHARLGRCSAVCGLAAARARSVDDPGCRRWVVLVIAAARISCARDRRSGSIAAVCGTAAGSG